MTEETKATTNTVTGATEETVATPPTGETAAVGTSTPEGTEGGERPASLLSGGEAAKAAEKPAGKEEPPADKSGEEEQKEGEGKPDKTAPVTAEDLKIPEGYEYDEDLGASFLGIVNDESLSRTELGQKLLDLYNAQQAKFVEATDAAERAKVEKWEQELEQENARQEIAWLKECKADKEFGGTAFEANQALIRRGAAELSTPECVKVLEAFKLGAHPEIVRMFYRAGRLLGEDGFGGARSNGKAVDPAEAIFGESLKGLMKGETE